VSVLISEDTRRRTALRKTELLKRLERQPDIPPEEDHDDSSLIKSEQIRGAHEDRSRERRKLSRKRERHVVKSQEPNTEDLKSARILTAEGAYFVARFENGEEVRAQTYKGTRTANPNATLVTIGDTVRIAYKKDEVSIIEEVLARRTKLARKAAGRATRFEQVIVANVDVLIIVASACEPPLRAGIIDRYIVAGLEGGLEITIVINKLDIGNEHEREEAEYFREFYQEVGYSVILVSATTGMGIPSLEQIMQGKISVFAGHSGVGKSSIVNAIFGHEVGRTGVLSKKYRRGAHTTSASLLMPIERMRDTYVVDTPGVREFANYELDSQNLKFFFAEFLKYQEHCAITNCSHLHEPGCAVRQAVEEDKITIERYTSYEKLFEEAREAERKKLYRE
jgi:ribosome biogenesis GTPase